ncbi:MAG: ISL3 family transposase [Candidatus Bathyarchaeota archaeon]|nr:ISL3 family transposase [Candidatus Bathyarchaeota archaeon]
MEVKELYRQILGIEKPWRVSQVELDIRAERIDVKVVHDEEVRWPCPECGQLLSVYDHAPERVWRHLDTCQFKTYLHARIPRVKCPVHGVRQVKVSWAEAHSRFTVLFERLAIAVLREANIEGAARLLRVSWDEAWNLMERAVRRGQKRKSRRVVKKMGVDEKSLGKGHNYLTLVYDLEEATVEYIADDRRKESLDGYFSLLSLAQRKEIEAIVTDIWDPYLASIREHVPGAEDKLVFDRYHLMRHLVEAVDRVRKQEHRELKKEGLEVLAGTKYLWLYSQENLPPEKRSFFTWLKKKRLKTARAWAIKESFRELWDYRSLAWAIKHFESWYAWAIRSRLNPIKQVARMFRKYLRNILTYLKHRITNAVSEGLNSTIQTIKKMACGFRNREHFKIAIYFHCGGLDLYPVTH